jgi:hypothetical protein
MGHVSNEITSAFVTLRPQIGCCPAQKDAPRSTTVGAKAIFNVSCFPSVGLGSFCPPRRFATMPHWLQCGSPKVTAAWSNDRWHAMRSRDLRSKRGDSSILIDQSVLLAYSEMPHIASNKNEHETIDSKPPCGPLRTAFSTLSGLLEVRPSHCVFALSDGAC